MLHSVLCGLVSMATLATDFALLCVKGKKSRLPSLGLHSILCQKRPAGRKCKPLRTRQAYFGLMILTYSYFRAHLEKQAAAG